MEDTKDRKTNLNEIEEIIFGVYSAEEIKKIAVCEVTNPKVVTTDKASALNTVYDPRMGTIQNNTKCPTCQMGPWGCNGHVAYVQLEECLVHPLFYKQVVSLLRCFCVCCSALLVSEEQLRLDGLLKYKGTKRLDKILEKIEKIDFCAKCKKNQPSVKYLPIDNTITLTHKKKDDNQSIVMSADDIRKIFDEATDEDVILLGFDPAFMHPRNLILTVFPVVPPHIRPYVITNGEVNDDDLTLQISEIVKINNNLKDLEYKPSTENLRQKMIVALKAKISAFYNNSGTKLQTTNNGRPIQGLKQRLSSKSGIIRGNLLAKRCEQTARTVIGPDPYLKLNEVGVPEMIANNLTIPVHVTSFNIAFLTSLIEKGKVSNVVTNNGKTNIVIPHVINNKGTRLKHGDLIVREGKEIEVTDGKAILQPGDKLKRDGEFIDVEYPHKRKFQLKIGDLVERHMIDGDVVLFNRQPSLHMGSLLGMYAKITKNKNFCFNLAVCKSYNSDFDYVH